MASDSCIHDVTLHGHVVFVLADTSNNAGNNTDGFCYGKLSHKKYNYQSRCLGFITGLCTMDSIQGTLVKNQIWKVGISVYFQHCPIQKLLWVQDSFISALAVVPITTGLFQWLIKKKNKAVVETCYLNRDLLVAVLLLWFGPNNTFTI